MLCRMRRINWHIRNDCDRHHLQQKSYLQIIVSAVACIANIAGNTLLVPVFGGVGAAISTGLSYIVFFAMRTILSNHYFPMKWDLGSFLVITVLFLGYALYNTFCSFSIVAVLGYTAVLAVLIAAYRDVIWDGWQLIKSTETTLCSSSWTCSRHLSQTMIPRAF